MRRISRKHGSDAVLPLAGSALGSRAEYSAAAYGLVGGRVADRPDAWVAGMNGSRYAGWVAGLRHPYLIGRHGDR